LYFRLAVCPVHLPSLRERRGDIWILFEHFWRLKGETRKVSVEAIEVMQAYSWPGNVREMENLAERMSVCATGERLEVTDLPANVRGVEMPIVISDEEFQTELERDLPRALHSVSLAERGLAIVPPPVAGYSPAEVALLPRPAPAMVSAPSMPQPQSPAGMLPVDLPAMLRDLEERYIAAALAQSGGNKALAAKMLGMQRTTLAEKLRRRAKSESAEAAASAV
jgi:sigma-54 dependent transcriptional regulator, flagellar regulatory protein